MQPGWTCGLDVHLLLAGHIPINAMLAEGKDAYRRVTDANFRKPSYIYIYIYYIYYYIIISATDSCVPVGFIGAHHVDGPSLHILIT